MAFLVVCPIFHLSQAVSHDFICTVVMSEKETACAQPFVNVSLHSDKGNSMQFRNLPRRAYKISPIAISWSLGTYSSRIYIYQIFICMLDEYFVPLSLFAISMQYTKELRCFGIKILFGSTILSLVFIIIYNDGPLIH